jgi:prolyl-tRNA editing enzyme YbaK/EbsC (Cys-tRNA(Pro) deacylase)
MEFGGITPIGLPEAWPVLVDEAVVAAGEVVIGSGLRGSKLVVSSADLAALPTATVISLAL